MKGTATIAAAMLISNLAFAQGNAEKAKALENSAIEIYQQKPDSAVNLFRQAADLYKIAGDKKAAAICMQNASSVHAGQRKDHYKAMEVGKEAVAIWRETGDTKGTADAYRFLAAQHVKLNDNLNAMRRSDSAVILYTDLKDYKDISLVYLNMASLYEGQRNVDSAAKYAARAKEASSKAKGGDAEMFHIDNTIFRIYVLGNRADDAKKLFKKLNKKVKGKDIDKEDKMGFYYYAWVYYNKLNQPEEGEAWKKQYDELKKQM